MQRVFRGWGVVAATAVALVICGTTFAAATFGVLTAHFGRAFGWSQAGMTLGLSIFLVSTTAAVPLVGRLSDRFGSRRVGLCGVLALAAAIACGTRLDGSILSLYLFYAGVGVAGAFTNPVAYLRAISLWFDKKRGLALGIAVAGQGAGGALLPLLVAELAGRFGWRGALGVVAGVLVVVVAPVVALFVKDDPAHFGEVADGGAQIPAEAGAAGEPEGLTLPQALRRPAFWLILLTLGLLGLSAYALTGNAVYLLTRVQSLSLGQAAALQSIAGLSLLAGRIVFGHFMDRWHAPLVGAAGVLLTAVGAVMLLNIHTFGPFAIAWAVVVGLSGGAETDLLTLLVGRYFGRRALAEIYSWHNVAFLVGAAAGPPLFGAGLALAGGATAPVLAVGLVATAAAGLLLLLGPYPDLASAEG
jgi:MFS family permease